MKITKTHLAKIIQEELGAILSEGPWQSTDEAYELGREHAVAVSRGEMDEPIYRTTHYLQGFKDQSEELASAIEEGMFDAIKDKLSPKRPTPAKAPRERSENDAEAMRLMGASDAKDTMHITGDYRESPSSDDEDYMAGWNSALQEGTTKMKITKSALAQVVKEELAAMKTEGYGNYKRDDKKPKRGMKGLEEDLAPYGDLEDYALEAMQTLGGEQPEGDIAELALGEWTRSAGKIDYSNPRSETVNEEEWGYSIQAAMDNLASQGRVRLTQGGPDDPRREEIYTLA